MRVSKLPPSWVEMCAQVRLRRLHIARDARRAALTRLRPYDRKRPYDWEVDDR